MPKQRAGIRADARALASYVKLMRASETVLREAARPLALYGLTPGQFGVLEALYDAGPQSLSQLAGGVLIFEDGLPVAVAQLSKRGLVRGVSRSGGQASRGGAAARIALTAKGRNLAASISAGYATAIVSVMSRLSPREQNALGALCGRLGPAARRRSTSSRS